nr:hypothetical protein [uncultured Sphingomonas sp.]
MRQTIPMMIALLLSACSTQKDANNAIDEANEPLELPPPDNEAVNLGVSNLPAEENGRSSRYVPLDASNCPQISVDKESAGWTRACPAVDGKILSWTSSDAREDLIVGQADLALNHKVAKGAFSSLGPAVEWRGPTGQPADLLIVRVNVAQADTDKPDISKLAIVRLDPAPCVAAVVEPGPEQNEKAREIADGKLPACKV